LANHYTALMQLSRCSNRTQSRPMCRVSLPRLQQPTMQRN